MLICFQKVNFITHFFLRILQQNSKLVTLGNLGIPGNTYLNWYCSINLKKGKKSTSHFSKDIAKILQTCYFGYFGHARLHIAKVILLTCRKLCFNFHCILFPGKTKDKMFQKIQKKKKTFWGHFGCFLPKSGQKWIFLEKVFVSFWIFQLSTIVQKVRKN